ncbi:hypothetical protein N2152v2_007027 [Parachlorella kessleri]
MHTWDGGQRAKQLHPDAQTDKGHGDQVAFVRLLTAYQVLSNARSRELYDLSISRSNPVLRRAAAEGVQNGAVEEGADIDISWGLGDLLKQAPDEAANGQSTMLDKLRSELQSDLSLALRHAYLGPRLDDLGSCQLPDCFEADERSTHDPAEVLELVSGRQLLGVVRQRRAVQLGADGAQERHEGIAEGGTATGSVGRGGLLAAPAAAEVPALGGAGSHQQCLGEEPGQRLTEAGLEAPNEPALDACRGQHPEQLQHGSEEGFPQPNVELHLIASRQQGPSLSVDATLAESRHGRQSGSTAGRTGAGREPEVLELILGGRLVATAVRHSVPAEQAEQHSMPPFQGQRSSQVPGSSQQQTQEATAAAPAAMAAGPFPGGSDVPGQDFVGTEKGAAPLVSVSFFRAASSSGPTGASCSNGEEKARDQLLLGRLLAEHEAATSNSPSAAKFLSAQGLHTHTVLRSASPLVRNLSIVAEPTTGVATARRSKATVFRARRAWLPPSALWLFKPRNYQFDIGGWYIEWAGHSSSHHPAWLDPAVCVLAAAFDTLDHERARQQPQGLFGRVRAGDETAGGALSWVKAMLRFHGVRGR